MSKRWRVCLPITGYLEVTVEAESEKDAILEALCGGFSLNDIVEWDSHIEVTSGNVFHGVKHSASAELIDDEP